MVKGDVYEVDRGILKPLCQLSLASPLIKGSKNKKMQNNNNLDLRPGFLSIILHAHLPFVRHPEYSDMMEERWLYEAITETYIPLIEIFYKLINEGIDFRITMTLTPPLLNMLSDELLMDRYSDYLAKLEELSDLNYNSIIGKVDSNFGFEMFLLNL